MIKHTVHLSKRLSYFLRHKPEEANIELDSAGWTDVQTLIASLGWKFSTLKEVVQLNDKKRFEFNEDRSEIRASQGHSVEVELEYESHYPFPTLYHGTVNKFLLSIYENGLVKGKRHHVHMSEDFETAQKVGARRGKPIVLLIDANAMWNDGAIFYLSTNGVWLTDFVPTKYLKVVKGL